MTIEYGAWNEDRTCRICHKRQTDGISGICDQCAKEKADEDSREDELEHEDEMWGEE